VGEEGVNREKAGTRPRENRDWTGREKGSDKGRTYGAQGV